jgi:hypothetical protein
MEFSAALRRHCMKLFKAQLVLDQGFIAFNYSLTSFHFLYKKGLKSYLIPLMNKDQLHSSHVFCLSSQYSMCFSCSEQIC